jgi:hypothetical protein
MLLRWSTLVILLAGLAPVSFVLAQSVSSTNFQNTDSMVLPLIVNSQSSNFKIDGSVESIVGSAQSASVKLEIGAQNPSGTYPVVIVPPPPPSGGGGGGGGGGLPISTSTPSSGEVLPTIDFHRFTYKNTARLEGGRGAIESLITMNGSSDSIAYPGPDRWQRTLPLGLGDNEFYIQSNNGTRVYGMVRRRLVGDVNDSRVVDDVDLSLFTRHWRNFDFQSDFNEDGLIDDIDLSLLASHWGKRF